MWTKSRNKYSGQQRTIVFIKEGTLEILKLLSVLTGDYRFKHLFNAEQSEILNHKYGIVLYKLAFSLRGVLCRSNNLLVGLNPLPSLCKRY